MNTNELIQHLESTVSSISRDLRFISGQITDNRELIAPLVDSIDGTLKALESYLKVFIGSLDTDAENEKALKNQAYFFIVHAGLVESFNDYCNVVTKEKVKESFPLIEESEE